MWNMEYISKLATIVEGDPKALFSIATTPRYRGGCYLFSLDYSTLLMICTLWYWVLIKEASSSIFEFFYMTQSGIYTYIYIRSGSTTLSYRNCVITLVGGWWGQSIARAFTHCMMKKKLAGGRMIGFIPFPRVLVLCEMQSVSSRIWTRVVVSISYDDNHYPTGTLWVIVGQTRFFSFGEATSLGEWKLWIQTC